MRISKANLPKIPRFHHIPGSGTNRPHFLKIFLISLGFAYDFAFCQNNGFVRIIQPKNTRNPLRTYDFVGAIPQIWYKKYGGLRGPENVEILEFQKVEISKIQIFRGCSSIFSCIFKVNSWEIRDSRVHYGSKKKCRNFGSSRNHSKSSGIDQEPIISYLGIIIETQ